MCFSPHWVDQKYLRSLFSLVSRKAAKVKYKSGQVSFFAILRAFAWNINKKPRHWRGFVAKGRFELPTFGLWARRATTALLRDVERKGNRITDTNQTKIGSSCCRHDCALFRTWDANWGTSFTMIYLVFITFLSAGLANVCTELNK